MKLLLILTVSIALAAFTGCENSQVTGHTKVTPEAYAQMTPAQRVKYNAVVDTSRRTDTDAATSGQPPVTEAGLGVSTTIMSDDAVPTHDVSVDDLNKSLHP